MEEEKFEPTESKIQKVSHLMGGGFTKERRNEIYFGRPPKGAYPSHRGLDRIHEMKFSDSQIRRLYSLSPKEERVLSAVNSDTKETLIKELVEQSSMRRTEAEEVVKDMLAKGILQEVEDPNLGKVLIFKGG